VNDGDGDGGAGLRGLLAALGAGDAEVAAADRAGTMGLLAVERLVLPDPPRYAPDEVAEAAGVPEATARQFWRALGFPDTRPGERAHTDADLEMLRLVAELLALGVVEPDLALQMTRVIGSSMARVAEAQVSAIESRLPRHEADLDGEPAALQAGTLLPAMPRILEYVWRRHLQAAARRHLLRQPAGEDEGAAVAVGFADLVGFTAMSQQVSDHELAAVVDRFELVAHDTVVALGGRVVKMIGDEVMFVVDDVGAAAETALALAETYHDDESLSDVRVGLAAGPVLERDGDVYGPVVNRASRIVGISYPGSVVVDGEVGAALDGDARFQLRPLRPRVLKDLGRVALWRLRWATVDEGARTPLRWVRERRLELQRRVAERLAGQIDEAVASIEQVAGRVERLVWEEGGDGRE
jgi:adenylate cyclase